MRRSSYYDKADKINYAKIGGKSQIQDLNFQNLKLPTGRVPENNFMSSRTPNVYFQSRQPKSHVHRPFTTQKVNSFLDHRSTYISIKEKATLRIQIPTNI